MYRCIALFTALTVAIAAPVCAQGVARTFPQTALRGVISVDAPPAVLLNGAPMRLSPGARLRDEQANKPWPTTPEASRTGSCSPGTQTGTQP